MPRIRAIRGFFGADGAVKSPGDELEASNEFAHELVSNGKAEFVAPVAAPEAAPEAGNEQAERAEQAG